MILPRIRQLVLANRHLSAMEKTLCSVFQVAVGYRDDLSGFGLENIVLPFGDTFLEVVSPIVSLQECAAGRLIEKVGGDCGYMVIIQTENHSEWLASKNVSNLRKIWEIDRLDKEISVQATHLHPNDIGAAILSVDQMTPANAWLWCGDQWEDKVDKTLIDSLIGCVFACDDPLDISQRWGKALNLPVDAIQSNEYLIKVGATSLKFTDWQGEYNNYPLKASALPVEFEVKCNDINQIKENAKLHDLQSDSKGVWISNVLFSLH